eukprot:TRINITY_DN22659_c0_g1_i1.p1 TRINITY_DN22659_c0_g1~~TRINITY_DN22659_c0_g1_i1.p1  ORF type:complete len:309 (-),score=64.38 TRINITY_DN22659_c0_g1_i1:44-835(-)
MAPGFAPFPGFSPFFYPPPFPMQMGAPPYMMNPALTQPQGAPAKATAAPLPPRPAGSPPKPTTLPPKPKGPRPSQPSGATDAPLPPKPEGAPPKPADVSESSQSTTPTGAPLPPKTQKILTPPVLPPGMPQMPIMPHLFMQQFAMNVPIQQMQRQPAPVRTLQPQKYVSSTLPKQPQSHQPPPAAEVIIPAPQTVGRKVDVDNLKRAAHLLPTSIRVQRAATKNTAKTNTTKPPSPTPTPPNTPSDDLAYRQWQENMKNLGAI